MNAGAATQPLPRETLPVVIIGAGPAGLTAAYLLAKAGRAVVVLEADSSLGGISRTVCHNGFRFDIGGHRFFSKAREVEDLWTELLPDEMLVRKRSSSIFYRKQTFSYPLRPLEAFLRLGPIESLRCALSYAVARIRPVRNPDNFEAWVTNQFGARLFQIFFKTYTEKVWGIPCKSLSADWAAQRINGLSLGRAIFSSFANRFQRGRGVSRPKTLLQSFRYPRLGPGMMWERCTERIRELGGRVLTAQPVSRCRLEESTGIWTVSHGSSHETLASHVISTAPIRELAEMLDPSLPPAAARAAASLAYRDFITVAVILRERNRIAPQWIYIHDPNVQVGRIQNFREWSPDLVPSPELACYGMEYFCFEGGEGLWGMDDAAIGALAERELLALGLAEPGDVREARVVRQKKAYPVYGPTHREDLRVIREEIARSFPGLHLVGRNGMHKYNNQDHSMMTAMLCAQNILDGKISRDPWKVNSDALYNEG